MNNYYNCLYVIIHIRYITQYMYMYNITNLMKKNKNEYINKIKNYDTEAFTFKTSMPAAVVCIIGCNLKVLKTGRIKMCNICLKIFLWHITLQVQNIEIKVCIYHPKTSNTIILCKV